MAVQALVELNAIGACLEALDGPHAAGALWALRSLHDQAAVDGLIARLGVERDLAKRKMLLSTLIRLYYQEGEFTGSWWNTRPDTSGPYYDRTTWEQSARIATVIKNALADGDDAMTSFLQAEAARNVGQAGGGRGGRGGRGGGRGGRGGRGARGGPEPALDPLVAIAMRSPTPVDAAPTTQAPIERPPVDPNNPNQIANLTFENIVAQVGRTTGDAAQGKVLFAAQSCNACHTDADGQTPKGPHLVDIGRRYNQEELMESILKPSEKIAQGFDTYAFATTEGEVVTGFIVLESADAVRIRNQDGRERVLDYDQIDQRTKQKQSMMPEGIVDNLTPEQLAHLVAYLQSLE